MGCMMPFVEGLRENRTKEGTPHVVGWGRREREREREAIAAGKH